MKNNKYIFLLIVIGLLFTACEGLLEIDPSNSEEILAADALQTESNIKELLNSAYDALPGVYGGTFQRSGDLLGDDLTFKPGVTSNLVNIHNRFSTVYFTDHDTYTNSYVSIMRANTVLENIDNIQMSDDTKKELKAECLFIRAICHFALVRLYSQPYNYTADNSHKGIVLKTNTKIELLARNTVEEVYNQIESDLKTAESDLPPSNSNFARATKWAAKAFLSQLYFQKHDYDNAFTMANDVVANSGLQLDASHYQRFLSANDTIGSEVFTPSSEVLFKLVSTPERNRSVGGYFDEYKADETNIPNIRIAPELFYNVISASTQDKRINLWYKVFNVNQDNEYIGCTKYNKSFKNIPLAFITEQKFIRAESALLKQSVNKAIAIEDLNDIRERAFGDDSKNVSSDISAENLLVAIQNEKRLELICEGFRTQDLKRRGSGGEKDLLVRGVSWDYPGMVLQITASEANELFELNEEPQ
ncbi:RagB/SusD family nutrient uptake outer membrane protein [Maribellus luteus]|uniref:RagB/SusD family nutrient uptake outer membrane protein n=1 Tax=Maribellus luteus TaxID=2305463 RepID=A0A399SRX5_9BACT|nr:RagB/SusD family nutrient uptake outer membrane protein [Maribellus luteus]RIJ45659.1 RagB/SusD family nutrient uptake outer membrane protein [Maribellus luteus]